MDESERKEVDASLVKAEIQLLFEGDPALRKAFPDLFSKACNGRELKVSAKNKDDRPSSATKDGDGDSSNQESDADDGLDEIVGAKSKQRLSKKKSRNAIADASRATIMNTQVQSEDSILEEGYDADDEKDSDDDGEDKKRRKAEQKLALERKTGEKI